MTTDSCKNEEWKSPLLLVGSNSKCIVAQVNYFHTIAPLKYKLRQSLFNPLGPVKAAH